jgi:hypothetical protein
MKKSKLNRRARISGAVLATFLLAGYVSADDRIQATPGEYDPGRTNIITSEWVKNLGLPDDKGGGNYGLLLSKNGMTTVNAAATVTIDVRNLLRDTDLTSVGYDVRMGGHCGAGAPRFNVVTQDGVTHFIGCSSPAPLLVPGVPASGWTRVRHLNMSAAYPPIAPGSRVKSIAIVFDEGTDVGPDYSGLVILDNIFINGEYATKR